MTEYIENPLSGKLRGVTYEDGKIIDVHIRDTDDVVKVFVPARHGRWIRTHVSRGGEMHTLYVCSECNDYHEFREDPGEHTFADNYLYCRKCGARCDL